MIADVESMVLKQNNKQSEWRVVSEIHIYLLPNTVECTSVPIYANLKSAMPGAAAVCV